MHILKRSSLLDQSLGVSCPFSLSIFHHGAIMEITMGFSGDEKTHGICAI
jgi:hypothetical protein